MRTIDHFDPFLGVDKGGNTLCGPYLPLSMARPGPDTCPPIPTNTNGYHSAGKILRFSQNHVSGTGGASRYGNIGVMPFATHATPFPRLYDKADEGASAGYYSVRLMPEDILTEITCTERCAVYRFVFAEDCKAGITIDTGSVVQVYEDHTRDGLPHATGGEIEIIGDCEVVGHGDLQGGWGHNFPYSVYFYAKFDRPFTRSRVANGDFVSDACFTAGPNSKALLTFDDTPEVGLTIAISYRSTANARRNYGEARGRSFDEIRRRAEKIWEERLGSIEVEGGTQDERTLLYTQMARLFCMPSDLGTNDEFHRWDSGVRHFTDYYCMWDSVRNANSLITLLDPELEVDLLNCLLDVADKTGWIPDAWIAGHSAHVQGGSSADILLCEAALKGLSGIDYESALKQMRKNNEVVSPDPWLYGRHLEDYRDLGYVSSGVNNCVSKHIEYSYQDWCIGRLAEYLGQNDAAADYYENSRRLWNLWNPEQKVFAPKNQDGTWAQPFNPFRPQRIDYWHDPHFYEGIAHEWSLCGLHDIAGLIERHGGREAFTAHLDAFFDKYLWHMKEMILHTPWLYHYAGRPDRSADRVREQMQVYRVARDGLHGNEDMGAHSAFIICSMIGIYPVMGQDIYLLGPPRFTSANIHLGQTDRTLRITCTGNGNYVNSLEVDGKTWERAWIRHSQLLKATELVFKLAESPGNWGQKELPPTALR